MALFRRQPDEAERTLLQATTPLVYRAIKLNINLFRWTRALDLAVKHRQHIDTVCAYRQKYLDEFSKEENLQKFTLQGQMNIDWNAIQDNEARELEEESNRSGGRHGDRK